MTFNGVRDIVTRAIGNRVFPAACMEIGRADQVLWAGAFGQLTYDTDAPLASHDTVFDLASLTKVVATTTLAMRHVDAGHLAISDRVADHLSDWRGAAREAVTVADLLAHTSGLPAYLPLFRDLVGRADFEREVCRLPMAYPPQTTSIYSDLGFILLGFLIEDLSNKGLQEQFALMAFECKWGELRFSPPATWKSRIAPPGDSVWRRRSLVGEVHDDTAWALGGAAGHTGLFGSAPAVGRFARLILRTFGGLATLTRPTTLKTFAQRTEVPNSSRALGWDTMKSTSSCGNRLSKSAIGHTGFTGTSLWIDPALDLYIVCLTTRVHPTATSNAIRQVRPALHNAVIEALYGSA